MKTRKTLRALAAITILLPVLAVFFTACEGGYDPGEEVYIEFKEGEYPARTLDVTVHISSKVKEVMYKVEWACDSSGTITIAIIEPGDETSNDLYDEISKRKTFHFTVKGEPTVTITVTLLAFLEDDTTVDTEKSKKVAQKEFKYTPPSPPDTP